MSPTGNFQLSDLVYQHLRQKMLTGELKPGQILNQLQICEELNISRAPLRDALIRLELQGFVTIYPRRGVEIKKVTLHEIENIYTVLGTLEGQCLRDVFHQLTQEDITLFEKINEQSHEVLEEKKFTEYYALNIEFHNIFLQKWNNQVALTVMTPLKQRLNDFPVMEYSQECEQMNLEDHDNIIHCIKKGNKDGAAAVLQNEHWSFAVYRKFFRTAYALE